MVRRKRAPILVPPTAFAGTDTLRGTLVALLATGTARDSSASPKSPSLFQSKKAYKVAAPPVIFITLTLIPAVCPRRKTGNVLIPSSSSPSVSVSSPLACVLDCPSASLSTVAPSFSPGTMACQGPLLASEVW